MVDPGTVGVRVASGIIAPLVRKLFVKEGPGAGLVERPVRLSALVSFKGEKRTLSEKDFRKLVEELVRRAAGETLDRASDQSELEAVTDTLELTLHTLGDLGLDDVEAVRLGHESLAAKMYDRAGGAQLVRFLSQDSVSLYSYLLENACLHILHFLTQRSTFVARSLVDQSRQLSELIARTDILIQRLPSQSAEDAEFEERYAAHIAKKHSLLTIYGVDLNECREWPLDTAYLSLEASRSAEHQPVVDRAFAAHAAEGRGGVTSAEGWIPALPQPVERALAGSQRVLLRGSAGSGKTTLVQWLAVTTARQDRLTGELAHLIGRVPFVLPLRTLTRGGAVLPAPMDFLTAVGCPLTGSQPSSWTDRVLSAGRGLLLIDGIDEVPEQERERTRRWLSDLLSAFPGNLWLVTSRPSAVRDDWLGSEDFTDLALSQMSRDNIAVFIRRWHEAAGAEPALGKTLLNAVRTKQDLGRLATNPLMCALVCALHRERRGFLPRGRKALYDAALSMLLERRDRERDMQGMAGELDEESQVELLQKLAYWLIRNGRAEMDRADAVSQLERLLPSMPHVAEQGSAEEILRYLLVRSGLLREPAKGAVDFVHRTFQDYLGARAAVEERDFDLLVRHAHLDQWEDVVRMAVAHARPNERARLLRGLLRRGDAEPPHRTRLHLLAMACLEHAAKLAPEVRREVEKRAGELIPPRSNEEAQELADIGAIVLELLPGPEDVEDEADAARVVQTACLIGGDAALPYLVRYRNHESSAVRHQLGFHWYRFDTETYAREIIDHLREKPETVISVRSSEELAALHRLGGNNQVRCMGDFTGAEISGAFGDHQLEKLVIIDNSVIDSLEFVARFEALRRLNLVSCPSVASLAPLTGLPLEELILSDLPLLEDLSPLRELTRLDMLSLRTKTPWPGLDVIAREAPLQCVFLPGNASGLAALGEFPSLRQLGLDLNTSPAPEDWQAIGGLEKLTILSLNPAELASLAATGTVLNRISRVFLMLNRKQLDLRQAVTAFPSMQYISMYEPDVLDLAPLASHPTLQTVLVQSARHIHNADKLADSVKLLVHPRR
ncbi:energy-coupling factor transporter ATP-binding protein EcfA2 [Streptomyces umbrinus]|uniref:Energy-coupling factor transporter ATP-binding protein EcfA2 n=1 Tax=Streptomyces umbrinus TaxID=67370 RepID=A0ABU0SXT8_9ACTN|nr:NACHT domain-containing protein [Streptomyces umbrinus]MDQ1028378.1 energy-coupling factor transporter ATP-binding protein EcfA2 [Streptomyces umbrinus]